MPKLSPRDAVKIYAVSRATLMRALYDGKISAEKTEAGHWQIDAVELARVYKPRQSYRTKPAQLDHHETPIDQPLGHDLAARLARTETALEAEREKNALLQRHLDDVRRMLPPPDAQPRRRWWSW